MLNGLEVTVLKRSEVIKDNETSRIDPEYFKKNYLEYSATLQKTGFEFAEKFADITDGIHASIDYDIESGIRLISATSPKENYFNLSAETYISQKQHLANQKTSLQAGDVIVSSVGTIGNCAVVDKTMLPANADRHVGVLRFRDTYLPHFVSTFLLTKYGRFQTLREATGNVQLNLFIYKLKTLKLPKLSLDFQKQIEKMVKSAYTKLEQSKRLYAEVEEVLLEELGLKNIDIAESRYNIGKFSDVDILGRMDAEYYKRKYENLLSHISLKDNFTLEQIADFSGGATPLGADYQESGIPFLRIQNVGENKLVLDDVAFIEEETHKGLLNRSQLSPRDVLLTITGRIGTTAVVPEGLKQANINQHIVRLRIKDKSINPYYLSAFLNSIGGKLQTEREAYGTTRDALPYYCLSKIRVLKAEKGFQNQIEKMILKAEDTNQESKRLLELSKRAVESAIEKGEKAGLKLLE